jgi:O-antigen/teichoic acid export membrane protein|tara:strand:+ start:283 stop:1599 length:1317 start_codon:yes stop_codon:yes gene_type:complete
MNLKTKITSLKDHSGFRKYFANTSWLMGERILRMGVSLFVGIYVARYLGPERYGLLSYANSFVGIFLALATLGLDDVVVRELVKTPEQREKILGTSFLLKLVGTLLMWVAIFAAVPFTENDLQTNILIIIIAFGAVFQAFNVIDLNFQAKVKSKHVVHAQFVQLIISSIVKIILVVNDAPLIWFASVYSLDVIVLAMGLVFAYLYNGENIFSWKWSFETSKYLLHDSWPLILAGVVVSVYMKIDQVMIKEMLGAKEVGLYAAAVKLSEAWYFLPMAIASSLFPAIINAKVYQKEVYYQRLQKLYDLMVWIAIAIALPISILSSWIVELLYGNEYLESSSVLNIHIWSGIFIFLGVASSKYLIAENYIKKTFYRTFVGALLNIIMNYYLIGTMGIKGAAISTFVSHFFAAYFYDLLDKDLRKMFILKTKSLFFYSLYAK